MSSTRGDLDIAKNLLQVPLFHVFIAQIVHAWKAKSEYQHIHRSKETRGAFFYSAFREDFHTAPCINYTCITVILTLFRKRIEFESQNACIINVWGWVEILPRIPIPEWTSLHSTVLSLNSRLKYAHVP